MRKKIILFLVTSIVCCTYVCGQVAISLQIPPVGVMQKSQLWNMALMNGGDANQSVTIELTLLSSRDNQPVMTASSRPLIIAKGTTQITARDAGPIQYNYLSPVFNVDRDPNGFLPVGNFRACYSVIPVVQKSELPLAEDCLPVEVQPLSPPQLSQPADTSTIETPYPQFSWLPPLPLNLFSNLTYDMIMVEVQPGQVSYEAIQQNIPVYNISRYQQVSHLYPSSYAALDTGRVYAWRILARNEDEVVAQSEVWTFRLASRKTAEPKPSNGKYISLKADNEPQAGINYLTEPILGIRFYSYDTDHDTVISFYDGAGHLVRSVQQKIRYGDNFIGVMLNGAFDKGKLYRVRLDDQRNNHYSASFTIN